MEADEVGLMLSAKACFDVRESVAFWQRMNIVSEYEGDIAAQVPEFLSTHPTHESRSRQLELSVPKVRGKLICLTAPFELDCVLQALELRSECRCPPLPARNPSTDVAALKKVLDRSKAVDDPWKPYIVVLK